MGKVRHIEYICHATIKVYFLKVLIDYSDNQFQRIYFFTSNLLVVTMRI